PSAHAGRSGRYLRTPSDSERRPSAASSRTALAVNCLAIGATMNGVSGVMRAPFSRFASPYPFAKATSPARYTPTAQPGDAPAALPEANLEKSGSIAASRDPSDRASPGDTPPAFASFAVAPL